MRSQTPIFNDFELNDIKRKDSLWIDILICCNQLYILKRNVRFEGHLIGQGNQNLIFSSRNFRKRLDDWMQDHRQILYYGYHTAVISDLMSKLKATEYMSDLKSKVKVINEVKVIQKMKSARHL